MATYRRRSSRRTRGERKIEHRQWYTDSGFHTGNVTLKAGADTDNVVKLAVQALKGDDQTILRTRGIFVPYFQNLGTEVIAVLGGIVLPNKIAANATASDLPNPLVDADTTDWFVWMPVYVPTDLGVSGGGTDDQTDASYSGGQDFTVDSKAKRIMEASESVVWLMGFNAAAAVSAKPISVAYTTRALVGY